MTRRFWPPLSVGVLALVSSVIGVVNQFTYDDRYIVLMNPRVHQLHRWWTVFAESYWPQSWTGDGYRPITILAFSVEWALGGGSPVAFHAANILLYVAVSVALYYLARRILPPWAAWAAAALFAVDPLHVEAVGNVVGQSELLVALPVVAAIILYLRDRQVGPLRPRTAVFVTLLYAVAALAKEHGMVLPAILLAAEFTIVHDDAPLRERVLRLRPFYLVLLAVGLGVLAVRSNVLSDHDMAGFQPFTPFTALKISPRDRILTAVTVVPQWIRLLFWPAHLASEYGPPALEIAQGYSVTQIPGLVLLLAVLALGVLLRRRQRVFAFGIAVICFALLPSSNFILPAGIMVAERTLFLPSVGAALVVGALAVAAADWLRARGASSPRIVMAAGAACAVVLVAGAARSWQRTTVWKDNVTLFRQGVVDAPDVYRSHFMLGALYLERGDLTHGEAEYRTGLKLFPYDPAMSFSLAEEYRRMGMCKPALPLYAWTLGLDKDFPSGRSQMATCLLDQGDAVGATHWILEATKTGRMLPWLHQLLLRADSLKRATAAGDVAHDGSASSAGKVPSNRQNARPDHRVVRSQESSNH